MKKSLNLVALLAFCINVFAIGTVNASAPGAIRATPPAPVFSDTERQTELAGRRANVAKMMSDKSMLIMFSTEPRVYTGDVDFIYRQENNLYYLTNLKQDNATLVLMKDGANVQEILFLPKRNPAFETWNGKRYSNEEAARVSGVKTILDAAEFKDFLQAVKDKKTFTSKDNAVTREMTAKSLYLLLPENNSDGDGKRELRRETEFVKEFAKISSSPESRGIKYEPLNGYEIQNAAPFFAELRMVKSPMELKLLQHAIDITTEAHMRAMATSRNVKWEYETQAEIEYIFRKRNADYWGYPSIVGCGPNATTIHYEESQGGIKPGDLLLMDVGAEYDHYTADVTRTFPINGKFTEPQKDIYQIVYNAQEAAAKTIKPGARLSQPSQAARAVIEEGLTKLGLITGVGAFIPGTEQNVPDGKGGTRKTGMPQYFLWYMHGWGHWLGMNVHDVGDYGAMFKPGMTMTNEPGIYIREDALDYLPKTKEVQDFIAKIKPAFEKYKNIGVRIEDDMLVTETGAEWMTKNLPRSITDIEAFMAKASKEMGNTAVLPGSENQNFAVLNIENNVMTTDSAWNPFAANEFMKGKTVRRGWISIGKNTAFNGSSEVKKLSFGE